MSSLVCELHCRSNALHLQQLFTGFAALARSGFIELRQTVQPAAPEDPSVPAHLSDARNLAHLEVVLDRRVRLYYDVHDSWEIDAAALDTAHLYFKRSFSAHHVRGLKQRHKVLPLGMFYTVHPSWIDRFAQARVFALERQPKKLLTGLLRTLDIRNRLTFAPRVHAMAALPDLKAPPAAIFMARPWEPPAALPIEKQQAIEALNDVRAQCIRRLRRELAGQFCGGFAHGDYARRHYPDCLVEDAGMADQRRYLERLQRYPIGITTQGLHGSTGCKLAEYVAHGKGVVTETPLYEVPGDFAAGSNYLSFDSVDECVEQTLRLFTDRDLRHELMLNNARYYQTHLRPDVLVLNTLLAALPHALDPIPLRTNSIEAIQPTAVMV